MKCQALVISLFFSLSLSSCATYPDVHAGEDGTGYVSFLVERKGDGNRDAMKQADTYCSKLSKKRAVLVKETFEYVGSMDEEKYSDLKAERELNKKKGVLPKAVAANLEKKKPSSAVMVEDSDNAAVKGKGYEYTLDFRCE